MALIDDVKLDLSIATSALDTKITDLIAEAKSKIAISGVLTQRILETDPLIKSAIMLFCKARFAKDEKDYARHWNAFEDMVIHLSLIEEYNTEDVT